MAQGRIIDGRRMTVRRSQLCLALLLLSACAVDRRPPFGSPGYVEAVAQLQGGPAPASGQGPFAAGWARAEIKVAPGAPLAGYGDRDGAAHLGVRDPVYVRAIALAAGSERVVLFASDLLLLDAGITERVGAQLADLVPPGALFYSASHTHSGPGAYVPGFLYSFVFGAFAESARAAVVAAHVEAAQAALAALAPARIGVAERRVPGLIANRVEKDGPTDDTLFVLSVERADGRRAAWWSFGCHAVTLPASNLLLSADYPGQVAARFEGQSLELLAFAAGGVGSSNPRYERPDTDWLVRPLSEALRLALAEARASAPDHGRLAWMARRVPLPPVRYRVGPDFMLWGVPLEILTGLDSLQLRALAIDDAVILQMPGELSGNLTGPTRARARRAGLHLVLTPFNGTYAGYVVPRRVYDLPLAQQEELQPYETQVLSFFGPWGGDLMMNLGLRMAARTAAQTRAAPLGD